MKIERGTGNRPLFLLTVSKKVLDYWWEYQHFLKGTAKERDKNE
jgi:hypothetical protein